MRDKLTDIDIRKAKPRVKEFKLSDGGGLHLLVKPNGSKLWRFRYRFDGKESMVSFGAYDPNHKDVHVSIAAARERCQEARQALKEGRNPSKGGEGAAPPSASAGGNEGRTFESVADEWLASRKGALNPKYAGVIERRLRRRLYSQIGHMDIAAITGPDLLRAIKTIEKDGIYLARRMNTFAGQIFRYAVAHGWAERDPSRDIRDGLSKLPQVRHRASLKESELPEFFKRLEAYDGYEITKLALRFILLSAVRTDELRFAPWKEIENLDDKYPFWRIPAERMKMPRQHLIPLAPQAVAVLKRARGLYPASELIFPSEESRSGVMSENAMLYALYNLGFKGKATVHGFRGTFSTVLNENGFEPDWIEIQLAHTEDDDVRAAYNAAQWLPQRREMMCWWADFLDQAKSKSV